MRAAEYTTGTRASLRVALVIVVAATVLSLSTGLRQSLGLFLGPMNLDLGVSASAFGFAMALQNIVWGISQPFIGVLGDRYGARPVLIVSALVYAAGLLLMAAGGPVVGLDVGGGVISGQGIAGTGFGVLLGAVSRAAPPEKRSQTVGLVSAAGSVGTVVLAPLGQALIAGLGWRGALMVFAAVAATMAIIAVAIGRESVGTAASEPGQQPHSTGGVGARGQASRLHCHGRRVLCLRFSAHVHHHTPAAVPHDLWADPFRQCDGPWLDWLRQRCRFLRRRAARRPF